MAERQLILFVSPPPSRKREWRKEGRKEGRRATGKLELVPEGVVEVQSENSRGSAVNKTTNTSCLERFGYISNIN